MGRGSGSTGCRCEAVAPRGGGVGRVQLSASIAAVAAASGMLEIGVRDSTCSVLADLFSLSSAIDFAFGAFGRCHPYTGLRTTYSSAAGRLANLDGLEIL